MPHSAGFAALRLKAQAPAGAANSANDIDPQQAENRKSGRLGIAEPRLSVSHSRVPGRARIHVGGLEGSAELKHFLERGLGFTPGVHAASASSTTGNLLVHFDRAKSLDDLLAYISGLIRGEIDPSPEQDELTDSPGGA